MTTFSGSSGSEDTDLWRTRVVRLEERDEDPDCAEQDEQNDQGDPKTCLHGVVRCFGHSQDYRSSSVLKNTSWTTSSFGPRNISLGGRLLWASANAGLIVHALKSSNVFHQVFTS